MEEETPKLSPLEQSLIDAMQALDSQVAREMQRSPGQRELQGVLKWEPFQKRIEKVCALVLNSMGGQDIELDSVLILAQAMTKSLQMIIDDLGEDGLGKVRSEYCTTALQSITKDCFNALQALKSAPSVS